ncbi:MAG: peptide chain release factor 1 [Clostridiaceae bacterium]|nr:peptide chain release factor 1 [Clostridiales bacterium]MDD2440697.1 peptide chain release factor 1 [Eubacteriales bacterium]MDD4138880.1 peptide chain release factor 1 [Eubacteriales bacterium]MDD4743566.1 peptide chain release factor 1 [Eubacteriales bacterium]NLB46050.1 peptide chain release factor 1 [Clostridiaceae bacterium]
MFEQLKVLANRFDELNILLADPAVIADQNRYLRLVQEHADLEPVVHDYQEWSGLGDAIEQHRRLLTDSDDQEFRELVRDELAQLDTRMRELEERLNEAVSPKDPNDARNVVMEIRAGAGGEEAALFAAVLYRMYSLYADSRGWHVQMVDVHETEIGGFKEAVFLVEGRGAYSRLRFESGVHRVQRVPVTESGGRIHTSTVTVAVLPEADDVEVSINPNDLEIDTFRASGAGGQHVNRTDSAIRITHKPTGLVVTCQDQRSQYKNKDKAMAVLKARLLERETAQQAGTIADDRRSQVGTGDRSERIRTYNYHQGRVTDHRIGLTLYRLESVLGGDIDEILNALMTASKSRQSTGEAAP